MPQGTPEQRKQVIDAALRLAAERGWRALSLAAIAKAASLPLADVYAIFPSKQAVLEGYMAQVDDAVLRQGDPDLEHDSAHDRLFEAVMRRFEAMAPHRPGVAAILDDGRRDPFAMLCGTPRFLRSMAATLEAAGIASDGLAGLLRAKGLGLIYLQTLRVWLRDDTEDQSRTMAALDRSLRRAESLCGSLCRTRRWSARQSPDAPAPDMPPEAAQPAPN
jgi:AcrR family transcriptional regulator